MAERRLVPTLDDFCIMPRTSSEGYTWVSRTVAGPILYGLVLNQVFTPTLPESSALAMVKGFIAEPGSIISVTARLRRCSLSAWPGLLGS